LLNRLYVRLLLQLTLLFQQVKLPLGLWLSVVAVAVAEELPAVHLAVAEEAEEAEELLLSVFILFINLLLT
jgi:hypothetical protein